MKTIVTWKLGYLGNINTNYPIKISEVLVIFMIILK